MFCLAWIYQADAESFGNSAHGTSEQCSSRFTSQVFKSYHSFGGGPHTGFPRCTQQSLPQFPLVCLASIARAHQCAAKYSTGADYKTPRPVS